MQCSVRPAREWSRDPVDPWPADVADLLVQMTRLDWPTSERDRRRHFDLLGLHDLDTLPQRHDEPDTSMIRFATSLPNVDGTCTMFRDEFLGLSLFCYNEPLGGPEPGSQRVCC